MAFAISLPVLVAACSFQQYKPKVIDTVAITQKIELKNPKGEKFNQFLLNNGYTADQLPLQKFGLKELTYCALFFHPNLDTARAQWHTAELAETVAAERTPPTINGHFARSNQANDDISPYAFGLSIDIPLDINNKREIRIENAKHLSQAAKLEIAKTAWELRNQVAQTLHEYQLNQNHIKILLAEQQIRQDIVDIYQKRVSLGVASNVELSLAKLQLQTTSTELNSWQKNHLITQSKLSGNLGLSLAQVSAIQLDADSPYTLSQTITFESFELQKNALLNRIDLRIALERYAASEAKLKLEIAKQYPDFTISPGYAYEFGDKIWSLGISSLLTLLNKNKIAIAEATQLREVEAAQFEALQSKVISDTDLARSSVVQAQESLKNQQVLLTQQKRNLQRLQRQLKAGEINRLEYSYSKLEHTATEKNVALAEYKLQTTINNLENAVQQPLFFENTFSENTYSENNLNTEQLKPTE